MKKGFVIKHWYLILLGLLVTGVYFVSRILHLGLIPIFTDEAIYLRWAQIAISDPRWRFISLIDGKQPLLIWLFLPVLKYNSLVGGDPLIAGRLVSVICGFLSLCGFALFGTYKTRKFAGGMIGALLYLIIPFYLVYDRLALYESLFVCISIWTFFSMYIMGKTLRLDSALITGTLVGFGLLTKSYANFFLILLPTTLLIVPWKKVHISATFFRWLGLALIVVIQSQIYANIMRLSEYRHILGQKNLQFIYSFSEFFSHPLQNAWGNAYGLLLWLVGYLTQPLLLAVIAALIWLLKKDWREGIYFISWFFVPFTALAFFGKVIYPRFLLFMLTPLVIILTLFITEKISSMKKKMILGIVAIIISVPLLIFDYQMIFQPIKAPLPSADRKQFLTDWPSGYGISEIVSFLENESKKK